MKTLKLLEVDPGRFVLLLNAGTTPVDGLVQELGHEPNGYFWAGVARRLVATEAPSLESRFGYDPEAGMFCAYGEDQAALEALGELMDAAAVDVSTMRHLIAAADAAGFDFDD